jgi:hypothetical protein
LPSFRCKEEGSSCFSNGSPLFKKPEIGNNPFTPVENVPAEKSIDATHELMKIIINDYERGLDYLSVQTITV